MAHFGVLALQSRWSRTDGIEVDDEIGAVEEAKLEQTGCAAQ